MEIYLKRVCVCTRDGHTLGVGAATVELTVDDSLSSDAVLCSLLMGGDVQHRQPGQRGVNGRLRKRQREVSEATLFNPKIDER